MRRPWAGPGLWPFGDGHSGQREEAQPEVEGGSRGGAGVGSP